MRLFLDANILVAVLNKEMPVYNYAARILSLSTHPRFTLYTSPIALAIAFYFAQKKCGAVMAKSKIQLLSNYIEIAESNKQCVINTFANKRISDFEDGLQYYAAENIGCDVIITEDTADFSFSSIEVHNSLEFLSKYLKNIQSK